MIIMKNVGCHMYVCDDSHDSHNSHDGKCVKLLNR